MGYGLGIDFGTTYCAAAITTPRGVEICTLGTRAASIPTVVVVRADGEVLVGEAAERRAVHEPHRAAFAFKRRIGDPTPLVLGEAPYGAETLTGYVLASITHLVTQQNGERPTSIVLSHPAPYGEYKIDLLRMAARQADLGDVSFISEPEAAAVHYATLERIETGQVVAVYDFGGGTFDAALLRKTGDGFTLIGAPEGLERVGGIDLDHAVLQHVWRTLDIDPASLSTEDPAVVAAVARLRDDCRTAKEGLSSDADVTIPVTLPTVTTHVRLTRSEFEAMIRPRIADTLDALKRAVRSAGLGIDDIDRILLVGGTSRIPLIREMVAEGTGRAVALDVHPKHSVAMGAAALAQPGRRSATAVPAPTATPTASAATAVQGVVAAAPSAVGSGAPAAAAATLGAPSVARGDGSAHVPPPSTPSNAARAAAAPGASGGSGRRKLVVIAIAAVLALAAIGVGLAVAGGGDDSPATAATSDGEDVPLGADEADAAPADDAPADSAVGAAEVTLPRYAIYGGIGFEFADMVIRTQDPEAFEAQEEADPDGPPFAYVEGIASNWMENVPVDISATGFTLVLSDGTEIPSGPNQLPSLVDQSQTAPFVLVFALPSDYILDGAILRIDDFDDEPLIVPFSGEELEPEPDQVVPISTAGVIITDAEGTSIDWAFGEAIWSLDAVYDILDFSAGQTTADRRAAVGHRWLSVPVSIVAECECDGVLVDETMISLSVDDTMIFSVTEFSEYLAPGVNFDFVLSFEVPAATTSATLDIGLAGEPAQETVAVEIP